ncbi:MAG TPA: cytochrome ubiquinol oxidase subunit I, partial [Bacillales bacterium]
PTVSRVDEFWYVKENNEKSDLTELDAKDLEPIHMPNNSYRPFVMSVLFFIVAFAAIFSWFWIAGAGLIGVLITMGLRSFEKDDGHYVSVEEIKRTEKDRIREG